MYHDRPCTNPTPAYNKQFLCTTATAWVTVCSWAVTGQGKGNNLHSTPACGTRTRRDTDVDAHAHAHGRPRLVKTLCYDYSTLARTSHVAQQLSICQIQVVISCQEQSHRHSCRPRGPQISTGWQLGLRLDHRRGWLMETISVPSQVTGLACRPSLCLCQPSIRGPPPSAALWWPQQAQPSSIHLPQSPLLLWMCRLPDRGLWLALACCPVVKVNLLHFKVTHHALCF